MAIIHRSGIVATLLLVMPFFMKAKSFGYLGLRSGYSHEMLSKGTFKINDEIRHLDFSWGKGTPLSAGVGFGHRFNPRFGVRGEAEYIYWFGGKFRKGILQKGRGQSTQNNLITIKPKALFYSVLANAYWDYYASPWLNFYLSMGLGAGALDVSAEIQRSNLSIEKIRFPLKVAFAWQVGLGVGYVLTGNLGLDFNLRYVDFGKNALLANEGNQYRSELSFSGVEALIGLNYRF